MHNISPSDIDTDVLRERIVELKKYTKNMNILIVEDYFALQQSLLKILAPLFKDVGVASDGAEALFMYKNKITNNEKYEIILSDIAMPNMNGIEMTKQIKNINHEQVIFIFSAHQDSNYLLELINLEVRRFLLKPILLKTLFDELLYVCKVMFDKKDMSNTISLHNNICYNKDEKELYIGEKLIKLSSYERIILELLLSKINSTISNIEIVNYLYLNGIDVELDNVRKMVYKLRKKISNDLIENIHSIGYRIKQ